jgi:benzoylformate decarboxylase
MRELLQAYYDGRLSRRAFFRRLTAAGFTAAAAASLIEAAESGEEEESSETEAVGDSFQTHSGTGADLLVEQVRAGGTRYIFSNPGSVEAGFFDALTDREDLHLVMGLHEGVVISMADGYHKVTGEPTFVNIHTVAGTAQAAGQLFNAHRQGSALIVTAGLQDTTTYSDDIGLAPAPGFSQIETTRQFTKISWEVRTAASAAVAIRRAYKVASTPPGGPVYVAFTRDAFGDKAKGRVWPKENFMIRSRPTPAVDQVEMLAKMLIEAKRPAMDFGDEVWKSGAQAEAVELAELVGASAAAGWTAYTNFPTKHPQYVGRFRSSQPYPFGSADLMLQFGARDPGGSTVPEEPLLAAGGRYVAVGIDTNMLGRTQPMDLSIVADVKEIARATIDAVKSMLTKERLDKIREERLAIVTPAVAEREAKRIEEARQNFDKSPIHPDRVDYELEQAADANAIIVEENFTGKHDFLRLGYRDDEKLRLTKGGSLGWGVGAAIGAKVGAPDRQVILSIGDGAVMYSASGFWTMARYQVPVLTVVCNNHNYQTVRRAFHNYDGRMAATGHYHGMHLGDPDIDFVALAKSQGVAGRRITSASDIADGLREGIRETKSGRPYLLEIVIDRMGPGADSTWHHKLSIAGMQATDA